MNLEYDQKLLIDCVNIAGIYDRLNNCYDGLDSQMLKVVDDRGIVLSGGEQQKVLLARALYKNGEVLILDEPTAALDPISEAEIYENFQQITSGKMSFLKKLV